MSMNLSGFDAETIDPRGSYDPIPVGEYTCVITESENRPTKSGTGSYLLLTMEVIEGTYKGRLVWERLNLDNKNSTAVEIAQRTLSSICHAVDVLRPNDSAELHDIPFLAKIGIEPGQGQYGDSNVVKGYIKLKTEQDAGSSRPASSAKAASTPPWKR